MRSLFLLTGAALAACAAVPPSPQQAAREQARLETHLAGRAAGQPVSCLPPRSDQSISISDNVILFRSGTTLYRNDPPGGCPGLGSGNYALVTRTSSSSLCRGEIAHVTDLQSGMIVGSCTLGDFVPYPRVRG